jgi:hypothetical protein
MAHPLSRLKLDYPLWSIGWSPGGYETLTARHIITGQILKATSIVELRALLANPGLEDVR